MTARLYTSIIGFLLFVLGNNTSIAQSEENAYYQSFDELLTTRIYLSRKFTNYEITDNKQNKTFLYLPSSTLNLGIGATYSWATLNLAYGFNFLNPEKGADTRYLDLQAHAYPKKLVVDFFGQFYKGYHLATEGKMVPKSESPYVRPDLATTKVGANVQYVFNYDKFSFRAAFLQNEWQKKSAGTFLLGFEMYGGRALGDSALVPTAMIEDPFRNYQRIRFYEFGPNAGAAYTLVIKKHFFITAAASSNLMLGYSVQDGVSYRDEQWGVLPNYFLRGFAGYNSARWSINANYIYNNVRIVSEDGFSNSLMTGNYRLNFVYRFLPTKGLRKYLDKIRLTPKQEEEIQTP
jgi:hypothetical protein